MTDIEDDGIDEAFKGFGEEPQQPTVTPPADDPNNPGTPPPAAAKPTGDNDGDKNKPSDNPEGTPPSGDPKPPAPEGDKPAGEEENGEGKPGEGKPADDPAAPPAPTVPEAPKPLTLDDVKTLLNDVRTEERVSGQALETATQEVLNAYHPDGLSNVLVDQSTGKELRTPQDVVDASGGQLSTEEAASWLMNEQYKLDKQIAEIKADARNVAETTLKFKQDGEAVLVKYDPIFKLYPQLQAKVWSQFSKLVKADEAKGVILSAPDMMEFYDTVLEPYRLAVEYRTQNPGTNPTNPAAPATPPAAPGADDRLDEGGDGGTSPVDDPNDFAQQVSKELAKGI